MKGMAFLSPLKMEKGIPWWHRGLRPWCCHCCDAVSVPRMGTPTCHRRGGKKNLGKEVMWASTVIEATHWGKGRRRDVGPEAEKTDPVPFSPLWQIKEPILVYHFSPSNESSSVNLQRLWTPWAQAFLLCVCPTPGTKLGYLGPLLSTDGWAHQRPTSEPKASFAPKWPRSFPPTA